MPEPLQYTLSGLARTLLAAAVAIVLGLAVDQLAQRLFGNSWSRIAFQFLLIFGMMALVQTTLAKVLRYDPVSNVFFISLFLGVQRHLLTTLADIQVVPH